MRVMSGSILLLYLVVSGMPVKQTGSLGPDSLPKFDLITTVQLLSTDYCPKHIESLNSASLADALFHVRIQIQNRGDRAVILSKRYTEISCPDLAFVKPDGSAGDLAYHCETDDRVVDDHYPRHLNHDFAIVQSRENFAIEKSTGLTFSLGAQTGARQYPTAGEYFLRIELSTWAGPLEAVAPLRSKWQSRGILFDGSLISNWVPVRINPPQPLSVCPSA